MRPVRENRSLLKYLLLSLLTLGLYAIYHQYVLIKDVNRMLEGEGRPTAQIWWCILLFVPTLTVYPVVWHYCLGKRLACALRQRDIYPGIGGFGQAVLTVFGRQCPPFALITRYRLFHATNHLAVWYNQNEEDAQPL